MTSAANINRYRLLLPSSGQQGQESRFHRDNQNSDPSRQDLQARRERPTTEYVYKGELLDAIQQHHRFRSQHYQQVSPQSRNAIESYLASEDLTVKFDPRGNLLDQFI